jgi:hypothetical protein
MNKQDQDVRRSTFLVEYPIQTLVLSSKGDYKSKFQTSNETNGIKYLLHSHIIDFGYKLGTIEGAKLSQCSLFIEERKEHMIEKLTFRRCHFINCFLGTNTYKDVRFENCTFTRCDFMNARFIYCHFENVKFEICSAMNCYFENSEINAKHFFQSLIFPNQDHNLFKTEKKYYSRQHIYSNYNLAKSLHRSNCHVGSSSLVDISLFELKKFEVKYLYDSFKHSNNNFECTEDSFIKSLKLRTPLFLNFLGRRLNLILTKGGTSIMRLILVALLCVLIFNFFFFNSGISNSFFNTAEHVSENKLFRYINWVPKTISIFLGYGFGAFKGSTATEVNILILCTAIGIFWYALLIPIVLRKVYK